MKFASFAIFALALALPTFAQTEPVTWDQTYDNPALPLTNVACSNGANGLLTKGYTNLGSIPGFPNVGGVYTVSWNSTDCGSCWQLTYGNTTIHVVAVDYAAEGFNLSREAMLALAGNAGVAAGRVDATAAKVDASVCQMN